MKSYRIKTFLTLQHGLTLVEMLIAIAITAVISTAAATGIYQVIRINSSSTNHQLAVIQAQNAVQNFSRDAQQAQNVIPQYNTGAAKPLDTSPPASTLISFDLSTGDKIMFQWTTWDSHLYQITYSLTNGILQKTTVITPPGTSVMANVANNIINTGTGGDVSGNWNTATRILSITTLKATVGTGASQISAVRTFQIDPRPAQ
jgi:prepilin-type N-terminal cleavage/methylation domain-containing protein